MEGAPSTDLHLCCSHRHPGIAPLFFPWSLPLLLTSWQLHSCCLPVVFERIKLACAEGRQVLEESFGMLQLGEEGSFRAVVAVVWLHQVLVEACSIFLFVQLQHVGLAPWPGVSPELPALAAWRLPTGPPGKTWGGSFWVLIQRVKHVSAGWHPHTLLGNIQEESWTRLWNNLCLSVRLPPSLGTLDRSYWIDLWYFWKHSVLSLREMNLSYWPQIWPSGIQVFEFCRHYHF